MVVVPAGLSESANSDHVEVKITRIATFDGTEITPPASGVTVVVGANNSGKSTLLREINQLLTAGPQTGPARRLVRNVTTGMSGSTDDLLAWLTQRGTYTERGNVRGFASPGAGVVPLDLVQALWERSSQPGVAPSLGQVAAFFLHYVMATNRVNGIAPQGRRSDFAQPAENPMHTLEDNPATLAQVRAYSERIFRQTLTLDPLSGNVQLRVGKPSVDAPPVDAVTPEYRAAVVALEPLQEQGDGMTAVLGLLVPILCGSYRMILIDEPEAFLHPPQARILGQVLGELSQEYSLQIIVATHDRNILVGLLQASAPVTVIRLERNSQPTRVHELDYGQVQELWSNPVLRYSNVLDGIFHRAVVLCEAERDCTFYAASLDGASEMTGLSFPPGDVLFVPTEERTASPEWSEH